MLVPYKRLSSRPKDFVLHFKAKEHTIHLCKMNSTCVHILKQKMKKVNATMAGFEPARSKSNGLAIHRLNHSATLSWLPIADLANIHNHYNATYTCHYIVTLLYFYTQYNMKYTLYNLNYIILYIIINSILI